MALCIETTIQSMGVNATLSTPGVEATLTPKVSDAYFAVVCPIDTNPSQGWDNNLGWDDEQGWLDQ